MIVKRIKSCWVYFIVCLIALLFSGIPSVWAEGFIGECCWTMNVTERDGNVVNESYVVKYGVSHMGGVYYSFQGVALEGAPAIFQASGIIIGSDIHMTWNHSENHSPDSSRDIGTGNVKLNLSTLSGPFFGINEFYDRSNNTFEKSFAAGTMTPITCP